MKILQKIKELENQARRFELKLGEEESSEEDLKNWKQQIIKLKRLLDSGIDDENEDVLLPLITPEEIVSKAKEFGKSFKEKEYNLALEQIKEFNKKFPKEGLDDLKFKEYVYSNHDSLSYWIDVNTGDVAHMFHDGFNREFGVLYSNKQQKYYIAKGVNSLEVSEIIAQTKFEEVKKAIISLIKNIKENKLNYLDEDKKIWHQVKTKIAYLYFPEKFIPICSKDLLKKVCEILGLAFNENSPLQSNNRLLIKLKSMPIIKDWHTMKLVQFIYTAILNKEWHKS